MTAKNTVKAIEEGWQPLSDTSFSPASNEPSGNFF